MHVLERMQNFFQSNLKSGFSGENKFSRRNSEYNMECGFVFLKRSWMQEVASKKHVGCGGVAIQKHTERDGDC